MANGMVTFAACLGIAATYLVFGTLIDLFDWPFAFLISGGVTFIVALIWTYGTRPASEQADCVGASSRARFDLSALLPVLRRRSVVCLTLSYAAYGYFQYLFFYWVGYYFKTIQQQDAHVARGYSTIITLAMGVGMLSGGWLSSRVPVTFSPRARRMLIPVAGDDRQWRRVRTGIAWIGAQMTLLAFTVSAGLLGLCEAGFWTSVVELGSPFGGTAAGLMNTGGNAGGTLSP